MRLYELWRFSKVVYKEVSFQSVFSLRSGGLLPQRDDKNIMMLAKNAELNVLVNKVLTTMFILVFALVTFIPHPFKTTFAKVPEEISTVGDVSAFLSVVLFMMTVMGLQVTTAFISSRVVDLLSPLPLSKSDISKIVLLCLLRIFDLPLACAAVVFVLNYGILRGSILGALSSFISIVSTETFALFLSVALSLFFYSRVSGGGDRSMLSTLVKSVFTVVWVLPALGSYLVANFATQITQSFTILTQIFSSAAYLLALLYPFSFGFLVSFAIFFRVIDANLLVLSLASSIAYIVLASRSLRWVVLKTRNVGATVAYQRAEVLAAESFTISPKSPLLALVQKDLRIASRSPSYSSLFFMPAIQTAVLAISFASLGETRLSVSIGILVGVSIVTLMIPPTLFSIEDTGYAYTKSLPLDRRTLISAKTVLSLFSYEMSFVALLLVAIITGIDFWNLMLLGAVHTFSIVAASVVELMMLLREFHEKGTSLGNLYLRLYAYVPVLMIGMALVITPLISALIVQQAYNLQEGSAFFVLSVSSIFEFAIALSLFLHEKKPI